jgi:purine nucleosidase
MRETGAIRVVLDTDPGIDDAVAILLTLASPHEIDLLCLTAVAGNVAFDLAAANAQRVCTLADRADVPVYAGADEPLDRPGHTATEIHGTNGLGGVSLPLPQTQIHSGGVDHMTDLLRARPGELTLCAIGPLTNLALAERRSPGVLKLAKQLIIMGGADERGNVTPYAEFNFYVDPLAAAEVFSSGAELVMFGLDVTRQVPATASRMARLADVDTAAACACHQMLASYRRHEPLLHDVCVIAWLIEPELFSGRPARVTVDSARGERAGQSLVEFDADDANALVMEVADAEGMFGLLCDRLGRLP